MTHDILLNAALIILGAFTISSNTLRVLRCRSVDGIALTTIVLSLLACLSWVAYGIDHGNESQVVANALNSVGFVIILTVGHHNRVLHASISGLTVGAFAIMAILIVHLFGMNGLGLTVSVLTFLTRVPQIRKAWMEPGGHGISISGQTGDATQSALWLLNGFILLDPWMISTSFYCMTSSMYITARTVSGRRNVGTRTVGEIDKSIRSESTTPLPAVA